MEGLSDKEYIPTSEESVPIEPWRSNPTDTGRSISSGTSRRRVSTCTAPSPLQDKDIPVTKKPRLQEPYLTTTADEATTNTASAGAMVALPPPADNATDDPKTCAQPHARAARCYWTLEEDAKLTSAVTNTPKKKLGKGYRTDWVTIAALVPSRKRSQCKNRWCDVLDPSINRTTGQKGSWTTDEDNKLRDVVQSYGGKNWDAIAALIPTRTKRQLRDRWSNVFATSVDMAMGRTGKWTTEEDRKLEDAVQTYGGKNWVAIALLLPGRTRKVCRGRWYNVLGPSIDRASSTKLATPDAQEAALPPADLDPMMATPLNASAAGGHSSKSTLENEVELSIRVVKSTIQRKYNSGAVAA
jgi:hypothetical protein